MTHDPHPRGGEDTYDLIDDALGTLATRRGVWLGDNLATIALITSLVDQAERWLPTLVHDARDNGHTWAQIAHARATSPEQARPRYHPDSPLAEPRWPHDL